MPTKILFFALFFAGLLPGSARAGDTPAGWKSHQGNYFKIGIPPGFVATPQGPSGGGGKSDAVSLWNQKSKVEFYVFSPQWNGQADVLEVADRTEVLVSKESRQTGKILELELTIEARDKSYLRFVVSRTKTNENTNTTFGIRIPNMQVYQQIRPTYLTWKQSLQQFAD